MRKKGWGLLPISGAAALSGLLVLFLACPQVENPPVQGPPASLSGTFAVALATRAAAAGAAAEFVADAASGGQVNGLGVGLTAVQAAPAPDPAAWGRSALELWFKHDSYFNSDGSAKTQTTGGSDFYLLWWDAYDPAGSKTSSIAATAPAADKVALTDSVAGTNKVARKKLQVGNTLLGQAGGVVVVVRVYAPGTAATAMGLAQDAGLLSQFSLTVTQADSLDLSGATLSAKGTVGVTAPTQSQLNALQALTPVPLVLTGSTTNTATVTLSLPSAAALGLKVAFNNFVVASAKSLEGPSWSIQGEASASATVLATSVALNGDAAATTATEVFFPLDAAAAAQVRADFNSAATGSGKVTLNASDKYGQQASIVVTFSHPTSAPGTFNIALASKIAAAGVNAQMVASGASGNQVEALALATTSGKYGFTLTVDAWSSTALEVWLDCSTYFNSDGSVKPMTAGSNDFYAVAWDAKLPSHTDSIKSIIPSEYTIAMADSATGAAKAGRKKLQLGTGFVRTVLVVVRIYLPGTAEVDMGVAKDTGMLSEFILNFDYVKVIDLNGTVVRAKGLGGTTAPTFAQLAAAPLLTNTVAQSGSSKRATATLSFAAAAGAGPMVAYNSFEVVPSIVPDNPSWTIKGEATTVAPVAQTFVELRSDDSAATSAAEIAFPSTNSARIRADFQASTTSDGQVTLTVTDRYGQLGIITVTLGDNK